MLPVSAIVDTGVLPWSPDEGVTIVVSVNAALLVTLVVDADGVTVPEVAAAVVVLPVGNFLRMSSLAFQPS